MPILRIEGKLIYFAHVPKCAGTAIERYLGDRFGALAFLDRGYFNQPLRRRWNKTSPQHILVEALDRLFPPSFFDQSFAVVRHPVDRMISMFRYQRDVERTLERDAGFSAWLAGLTEEQQKRPFYLDNHTRPMSSFVPETAKVFRLEDGVNEIIPWLDKIVGSSDERFDIRERNTYGQRLAVEKLARGAETLVTAADRALIAKLYAIDFERFGYAKDE